MDNLRGIALMVASMAGFSVEDALIKRVAEDIPSGQIILVLGLIGGLVFGLLARARGLRLLGPALVQRSVAARNLSEMIGTICYVSSFVLAPLSIASSILQATPLFVTLGAALFLGAPVGWRRWTAILIGFIGVLIIVRPGGESFHPASLLAVAAVIFLAIRDLATRTAPPQIASLVIAFYGYLSTVPAAAILLWFQGGWVAMPTGALLGILAAAAVGLAAYYAIIAAMRIGDVAVVTPFRYARIVFALILGVTVFHETVDLWTLAGAAIVVLSGLYTLFREARAIRAARMAAADR